MTRGSHIQEDQQALERLKSILLRQDREALEEIRDILNDKEKLSKKVKPIILDQFEFFKDNFSREYEEIINELIDKKLKQSESDLLDIIYPSLGKMISKYVTLQMTTLKESIENSVKSKFSFTRSVTSFFTGVKESDLILKDAATSDIEEVYVIQKDSGLLLASASNQDSMDKDVVAGMLTAIKSFVEDAFNKTAQDLETIEYGSYKIVIRSYYSFYIAVAISGALSTSEREILSDKIDAFAAKEMKTFKGKYESAGTEISNLLEQQFMS
jgi:hypothetical protein